MSSLQHRPATEALVAAIVMATFAVSANKSSLAAGPADSDRAAVSRGQLERVERDLRQIEQRAHDLTAEFGRSVSDLNAVRQQLVDANKLTIEAARKAEIAKEAFLQAEASVAAAQTQFDRQQKARIRIFTLAARMATTPTLFQVNGQRPVDWARTSLLIADATRQVTTQTIAIANEARRLSDLRDLAAANGQIALTSQTQAQQSVARLETLEKERTLLAEQTEAARQANLDRQRRLIRQARDIRDLLNRIGEEHKSETATETSGKNSTSAPDLDNTTEATRASEITAATSSEKRMPIFRLHPPVVGTILLKYGQNSRHGDIQHGLTYETLPESRVTAAAEGTVIFAGPFQGYGLMLILEHGRGYHSLLSGMGRIDVTVGQKVFSGEPVGQMDGTAGGTRPRLYFELRRGGSTIDPQYGFAQDSKGQG